MPKPESQKVPVTLVTGFLGSGKTTLLNNILRQKGGRRVAVVENEVGEINIDNSLVAENLLSKEDLVAMDRGCVCCSLRKDIVKALQELQGRAASRRVQHDAILLETTGLADPAPVAFTFFSNPWISANYRLDSILCLVDAQHLSRHLEDATGGEVNEAVNQIAFADIILINKTDLVSEEELQKAKDLVRSINVTADVVDCQLNAEDKSTLPTWDQLMGINSFSIERALEVDPGFMDSDSEEDTEQANGGEAAPNGEAANGEAASGEAAAADSEGAKAEGADAYADAGDAPAPAPGDKRDSDSVPSGERRPKRRRKQLHDLSGVGSVGITARGPLDKYRFNCFMRDLLGERARDIFRCKGLLCIKGQESTKFVFQGVHETVCFGPAATGWGEGEEPVNQIVFIGRKLSRQDLVEGLRSCVWVPLPEGWVEHHDSRSTQPYYLNSATGRKQWERPTIACALVKGTETSHKQPNELQPRRSAEAETLTAVVTGA